jgi:hypothetical protein
LLVAVSRDVLQVASCRVRDDEPFHRRAKNS